MQDNIVAHEFSSYEEAVSFADKQENLYVFDNDTVKDTTTKSQKVFAVRDSQTTEPTGKFLVYTVADPSKPALCEESIDLTRRLKLKMEESPVAPDLWVVEFPYTANRNNEDIDFEELMQDARFLEDNDKQLFVSPHGQTFFRVARTSDNSVFSFTPYICYYIPREKELIKQLNGYIDNPGPGPKEIEGIEVPK